jgi:hypothetical protein
MIRNITDLPAYGSQTGATVEVEAGGAFYNAPYAAGASVPPWSQVAFSAPLSANFNDLKGHTVTPVGTPPTISGGRTVFTGAGGLSYNLSQFGGEDLQIRNMPFTLEGWFSCTSNATNQCLFDTDTTSTGAYTLLLNLNGTVGNMAWLMNNGSASVTLSVLGVANDGTRHHVAIVCVTPLLFYFFLDGVLKQNTETAVSMLTSPTSHALVLGSRFTGSTQSLGLVGTMDNWRWTKGFPLYPGVPFTVPTPPFATS